MWYTKAKMQIDQVMMGDDYFGASEIFHGIILSGME